VRGRPCDVVPLPAYAALSRVVDAADQVHQGRLSCAVGTDQSDNVIGDLERDVAQDVRPFVPEENVRDL